MDCNPLPGGAVSRYISVWYMLEQKFWGSKGINFSDSKNRWAEEFGYREVHCQVRGHWSIQALKFTLPLVTIISTTLPLVEKTSLQMRSLWLQGSDRYFSVSLEHLPTRCCEIHSEPGACGQVDGILQFTTI